MKLRETYCQNLKLWVQLRDALTQLLSAKLVSSIEQGEMCVILFRSALPTQSLGSLKKIEALSVLV